MRYTHVWPPTLQHIIEYTAFMSQLGYAYKTVNCHISAISLKNKINSMVDMTKVFIVRKMLDGMKKIQMKKDTRRPINIIILSRIVYSLSHICMSQYEVILFKLAFLMAFFCLLRVSEIKFNASDLQIVQGHLVIYFRHTKTDQYGIGTSVNINLNNCSFDNISLAETLWSYKRLRPNTSVQFLCHIDGTPLTPYQFRYMLNKSLSFIGESTHQLKSHSFRIGGATYLYSKGVSEQRIKEIGRWKSPAFKGYIRP
jgi:integrase